MRERERERTERVGRERKEEKGRETPNCTIFQGWVKSVSDGEETRIALFANNQGAAELLQVLTGLQ